MKAVSGSFCWFELATTDQRAAKAFYSSLFGWTSTDGPGGPGGDYTVFALGDRTAAAAYTMRDEMRARGVPPNWTVYIAVDDADRAAARAASLGGTVVVPPLDVMDAGRMAVLQDPQGAAFAVWQAGKHGGVGTKGEVHSVSWADLQTRDQPGASAFYSALFGWRMVEGQSMAPAQPGDYYHIVNGEAFIGGVPPPGHGDPHAPPHWLIYVEVADCRAATARAVSLGARAYVDTLQIGKEGSISVLADPQGAVFALHQTR
jgi:uncharacterized protein